MKRNQIINLINETLTKFKTPTMKTIDGIMIYYRFECDDKNRPSNLDTDEYFELSEYDKVMKMKDELDFNGVNYTLLLERFNSLNDDIISRDYFIANNDINN